MKFEGKPEKFIVTKQKKGFQIDVAVKGQQDFFNISLFVFFEGSSTLNIISNNRESISYLGEISPLEKEKKE